MRSLTVKLLFTVEDSVSGHEVYERVFDLVIGSKLTREGIHLQGLMPLDQQEWKALREKQNAEGQRSR